MDRPCVLSGIGQLVAGGVTDHVCVNLEGQLGLLARLFTIQLKLSLLNGAPPRSDVNTNADFGSCSFCTGKKRAVATGRRPNAAYRKREHLTETEIEKLIEAAKGNRYGHRDTIASAMPAARHREPDASPVGRVSCA
jgi:hypothetical protein